MLALTLPPLGLGWAVMPPPGEAFAEILRPLLQRFLQQTGQTAMADATLAIFIGRLWQLIGEKGLPAPLARGECGAPQEMTKEEVAPLIEQLLAGLTVAEREALATPARQLVKACFHGEFKVCRDSYREVSPDGSCRRQELKRVRERISGSHCVDCPYWMGLTPEQHGRLLAKEWRGEATELAAHRAVFLPDDFRALRRFIRSHADSVRT